jgi:hypothetical protein
LPFKDRALWITKQKKKLQELYREYPRPYWTSPAPHLSTVWVERCFQLRWILRDRLFVLYLGAGMLVSLIK